MRDMEKLKKYNQKHYKESTSWKENNRNYYWNVWRGKKILERKINRTIRIMFGGFKTEKQIESIIRINKDPKYQEIFKEARKKAIAKSKELNKNPEYRERMLKRRMEGLMKRPTSLEKQFIGLIEKYNLPYKYTGNGSFIIGYKNPDFVNINGEKICIEVANKFHHQGDWERKRIEHFSKYGWKCLVFWERTYNKLDEAEIMGVLK